MKKLKKYTIKNKLAHYEIPKRYFFRIKLISSKMRNQNSKNTKND